MSGPIATLVEDAVACVAAEHPAAYAALERALGARRFDLEIDDEQFMLDIGIPTLRGPVVSVTTDIATLYALVHGEQGLLDAALAGRLDVRASADDLVAVSEALTHFVQGAMRCVSMQQHLDRLATLRKERM